MARDDQDQDYLDELNAWIDDLVAGRAPQAVPRDSEEAQLLQIARSLRALGADPRPDAGFVRRLGRQLDQQDRERLAGRRRLLGGLVGGLAAGAAALAGGMEAEHWRDLNWRSKPLVGMAGQWYPVAKEVEAPSGRPRFFAAGGVQGYLINTGGAFAARSAICTHMGCLLAWRGETEQFACPCHGATFDQAGRSDDGRGHPTLPPIQIKVEGGQVFAWGPAPPAPGQADLDTPGRRSG